MTSHTLQGWERHDGDELALSITAFDLAGHEKVKQASKCFSSEIRLLCFQSLELTLKAGSPPPDQLSGGEIFGIIIGWSFEISRVSVHKRIT